jgi:hypothetical protein
MLYHIVRYVEGTSFFLLLQVLETVFFSFPLGVLQALADIPDIDENQALRACLELCWKIEFLYIEKA